MLAEGLGEAGVAAGVLAVGDAGDMLADAVGVIDTDAVALGISETLGLGLGWLFWEQPANITPTAKTITMIKNTIFLKIQSPPSILVFSFSSFLFRKT